jgi:hypothetical protein
MMRIGFNEAKRRVIAALDTGQYQHESREGIDTKNLLLTGQISAQELKAVLVRSNGNDHVASPHHADSNTEVHIIKHNEWYVKFYFVDDPDTVFISVHK